MSYCNKRSINDLHIPLGWWMNCLKYLVDTRAKEMLLFFPTRTFLTNYVRKAEHVLLHSIVWNEHKWARNKSNETTLKITLSAQYFKLLTFCCCYISLILAIFGSQKQSVWSRTRLNLFESSLEALSSYWRHQLVSSSEIMKKWCDEKSWEALLMSRKGPVVVKGC